MESDFCSTLFFTRNILLSAKNGRVGMTSGPEKTRLDRRQSMKRKHPDVDFEILVEKYGTFTSKEKALIESVDPDVREITAKLCAEKRRTYYQDKLNGMYDVD
jgi:hypothetical protein